MSKRNNNNNNNKQKQNNNKESEQVTAEIYQHGDMIRGPDNEDYKIVNNADDILVQAEHYDRIAFTPSLLLKTASMSTELVERDKRKQEATNDFIAAKLGPNVVSFFEDAYDQFSKWQFHDTWRRDGEANRIVQLKSQFVIGENVSTVLDVNRSYPNEDQSKRALELITNNTQYQYYKADIDTINQRVQFSDRVRSAYIAMQVYGRAVLQIDYDEDGVPARLKPLNSMRLGRVFHDKDTWEVAGIEYLDYNAERGQTIIKSEDMIYLVNKNFHISPNTYQYGTSDIETIADISETNRIINEIDMKESARRSWAPYVLIKFKRRNAKVMQDFINKFKEGKTTGTSEDVDVQIFDVPLKTGDLSVVRDANERKIAADMGVPTFLLGRESVTNRATSQTILQAFEQSTVKQNRAWLKMQIEDQWIKPLLLRLIDIKKLVTGQDDIEVITPDALMPEPIPPTAPISPSAATSTPTGVPPITPKKDNLAAGNSGTSPQDNNPIKKTPNLPFQKQQQQQDQQQDQPADSQTVDLQKSLQQLQQQKQDEAYQQAMEDYNLQVQQRQQMLSSFSVIDWQRQRRLERLGATQKPAQQQQQQQQQQDENTQINKQNPALTQDKTVPPNAATNIMNVPTATDPNRNQQQSALPVDEEGNIESEISDEAEMKGLPIGFYAEDLEYRVKIEFEPIHFDTLTDVGPVVVSLKTAGILDAQASLEVLHMDKYAERIAQQEADQAAQQQQQDLYNAMMAAEQQAMTPDNNNPNNPNPNAVPGKQPPQLVNAKINSIKAKGMVQAQQLQKQKQKPAFGNGKTAV